MSTRSDVFDYNACIVRPVSSALFKALRMEEPENPIDVKRAQEQHRSYTETLKQLLPHVFEVRLRFSHHEINLIKFCGLYNK